MSVTSLAAGHAVPRGLGKPPKWKLRCGSFQFIQLFLYLFSYFEVSRFRSCCVPCQHCYCAFLLSVHIHGLFGEEQNRREGGRFWEVAAGRDPGGCHLRAVPVLRCHHPAPWLYFIKATFLSHCPTGKKKPREGSSKCMEQEGRWSENPV